MAKRHWNRRGDLESLFLNLEELVLASSGEDEFEEIFKLIIAKLWDEHSGKDARFFERSSDQETFKVVCNLLREAENAWPGILGTKIRPLLLPEHLKVCVGALSQHSIGGKDLEVLDRFFEHLVSKGSKGAKGQFFTPRHIVELCVRMLRPSSRETVCDPGCGSGGFLFHTMNYVRTQEGLLDSEVTQYCRNKVWGFDIDNRAVRVAKALMLLAGDGKANIIGLNSLLKPQMNGLFSFSSEDEREYDSLLTIEDVCRTRRKRHRGFDLVLTNPPFAGEVRERNILNGYKVSYGKTRIERDVLFIERCIELLRPGGRLAIVLPHNKLAGTAFLTVRKQLLQEAKILGVVGLGRNSFLPHTHQKASVLFAQRRLKGERKDIGERVFFAISEKSGKDTKGRPLLRNGTASNESIWDLIDHDFEPVVDSFHRFLDGWKDSNWQNSESLFGVKNISDIGHDLIVAPERYDPRRTSIKETKDAKRLGELVKVVRATVNPKSSTSTSRFLVLDTSDAREGVVNCRKTPVNLSDVGSTKKTLEPGCVIISRLRPYLRQVALIDREIPSWDDDVQLLCSTEFFVLHPRNGHSIGFLVPFLLSAPVQKVLAVSQEGGHHPRFDQATLLDLPVPTVLLERRDSDSKKVENALAEFRNFESSVQKLVNHATQIFENIGVCGSNN